MDLNLRRSSVNSFRRARTKTQSAFAEISLATGNRVRWDERSGALRARAAITSSSSRAQTRDLTVEARTTQSIERDQSSYERSLTSVRDDRSLFVRRFFF